MNSVGDEAVRQELLMRLHSMRGEGLSGGAGTRAGGLKAYRTTLARRQAKALAVIAAEREAAAAAAAAVPAPRVQAPRAPRAPRGPRAPRAPRPAISATKQRKLDAAADREARGYEPSAKQLAARAKFTEMAKAVARGERPRPLPCGGRPKVMRVTERLVCPSSRTTRRGARMGDQTLYVLNPITQRFILRTGKLAKSLGL